MPMLFVWVPCFSCVLQLLESCCLYRCHCAAVVAVVVVAILISFSLSFFASEHTFLVHCCRHFSVYFCLYYYLICVVCSSLEVCAMCVFLCAIHASTFKKIRRFSQSLRISQAELLIWHPLFVCLSIWRFVCVQVPSNVPSSNGMCVRVWIYTGWKCTHTHTRVIPLTCSSFYADVCHLFVCLRHF